MSWFETFRGALVAAVLAGGVLATRAQSPAATWMLPSTIGEHSETWSGPWRHRSGDDPQWSAPGFSDAAWETGTSRDVPRNWSRDGGWQGTGWFRLQIDTGNLAQRTPLLLVLEQAGASEIFLDGQRVTALGRVGPGFAEELALRRSETPPLLTLEPGRRHLLAIRHSNFHGLPLNRIDPRAGGFQLTLAPHAEWTRNTLAAEREKQGAMMFFIAAPLLLAAIHFALFVFLPRSRDSLYCALFMCALSALTFTRLEIDRAVTVTGYLVAHRVFLMAIVAFSSLCLLTIYTTFARPKKMVFAVLQTLAGALLIWPLFDESRLSFQLCSAFGFVVSVEAVRVTALAVRERRDGAALVLGGMVLFGIAVLYNALRIFNLVPELAYSTHTMNFGILAAAMGMSFFISRNYALTTKKLERKLVEVAELSARNLAHEREKQAIVEGQKEKLELQVRERTAELSLEKAKSDELLANILPHEIAAELKERGTSAPRRYEEVTILFSDFTGFTSTVSAIPAHRLIKELNEIFRLFDDIADREGIEKIKTIGDAYMAAGGLPEPRPDHAQRCVRAALAMQASIAARNEHAAIKWQMRMGLHTGPVVGGVVGKRKFTFDVFGDTVNLASRMESSAQPGQINLSAYTYDLVREEFDCEYRGKVDVKGKGQLDHYSVRGPKAHAQAGLALS